MTDENPGRWYVALDAAAFVPSTLLNLFEYSPDFVCLSFYKIFGFPTGKFLLTHVYLARSRIRLFKEFCTGIGALLVKKGSPLSKDTFFAGGTTEVYLPSENFRVLKPTLHEQYVCPSISSWMCILGFPFRRYEEGTIGFLGILALKYGFQAMERIAGPVKNIQNHTFELITR